MKRRCDALLTTALVTAMLSLACLQTFAASPAVSNVVAQQRAATKLMDIRYDVADADSTQLTVRVQISSDNGTTFTVPANHLTNGNPSVASYGEDVTPGTNRWIVWDAEQDWNRRYSTQMVVQVTAVDVPGMELIPAGSFEMGDSLGDGGADELPVHTIHIGAFLMDRYEVTWALWTQVRNWAITNSYTFTNLGDGKGADHPAHSVSWYDCVKWCNARSEREGRVPCYYTDASQSNVYRVGELDLTNAAVKWDAGGYRLPTEAEWEYAARGGLAGERFPWGVYINHDYANYSANGNAFPYDTSPYTINTYHPDYDVGGEPYTSPVGAFELGRNGFGLYDMAGNVWEWCWDRHGGSYYSSSPGMDPRGPDSGSSHVRRGGGWGTYGGASGCRVAFRSVSVPGGTYSSLGFRAVLPAGQ
jgi:formylglycine-generating enzyme